MDLLVRTHRRRRVLLGVVGRTGLCALRQNEHEDRSEASCHPGEQPRTDASARKLAWFATEEIKPVLFVATLSVSEALQDLPLLAGLTQCELLVDHSFSAFLNEVPRPASTICGGRLGGSGRCHESSMLRGTGSFNGIQAAELPSPECGDCQHFGTPKARPAYLRTRLRSTSMRACNCVTVACATAGPPQIRRSSACTAPCGSPPDGHKARRGCSAPVVARASCGAAAQAAL